MDFKEYCNTFKNIDLTNMNDETWRFIGFFVEWSLEKDYFDDKTIAEQVAYIKKDHPRYIAEESEKSYEDIPILGWLSHLFWSDSYASFTHFSNVLEENGFAELSNICKEYLREVGYKGILSSF